MDVAADPDTRTVPFELELPNPDFALRPELVVDVVVPTGEEQALVLVPLAAVLRGADTQPFCFVVGESETAERRVLALGTIHDERVSVSGLETGERVIVRGQHFLRAGERVRVLEE